MTRIRIVPDVSQGDIKKQDFKFPPKTPKAVRAPGWKLGSGFEGIQLQAKTGSKATKATRRKAQHVKHARFCVPPVRSLDLSSASLPAAQSKTCRTPADRQAVPGVKSPPEATFEAREDTVRDKYNQPVSEDATHSDSRLKESAMHTLRVQLDKLNSIPSSSLNTNKSDGGQGIRHPSKSECEGWLKRRNNGSLTVEANADMESGAAERRPDLAVTPRLKRVMSSVPFRPPLKTPL